MQNATICTKRYYIKKREKITTPESVHKTMSTTTDFLNLNHLDQQYIDEFIDKEEKEEDDRYRLEMEEASKKYGIELNNRNIMTDFFLDLEKLWQRKSPPTSLLIKWVTTPLYFCKQEWKDFLKETRNMNGEAELFGSYADTVNFFIESIYNIKCTVNKENLTARIYNYYS